MCNQRIKTAVLDVTEAKEATVSLPMYWRPIAVLDTNTHTRVPCVIVEQIGDNVLAESDERRHLFDLMQVTENARQVPNTCNELPKLSGVVKIQLPSYARTVQPISPNPYILIYEETHD